MSLLSQSNSSSIVPEFREMIEAGRKYLDDEICFMELRGNAVACAVAAKLFSAPTEILEMAESWTQILESHWNEWGLVPDEELVSAEDVRALISKDLDIFEPHDHLPSPKEK